MPTPVKSDPSAGRFSLGLGHLVFVGVFVLRLWALIALTHSPLLLPTRGDMHFYNDWRGQILHGHFVQTLAFYGLPGYAYLLAGIYKIFGQSPFVPGLLQAALDADVAVLIYQICLRIFGSTSSTHRRAIGLVATVGWAFFVPAQAYSVVLMPTAWFVFVFWYVVWRIVRFENAPSAVECFLLAVVVGVTATAVAAILPIVALALAALLVKSKKENLAARPFTIRIALFILGI